MFNLENESSKSPAVIGNNVGQLVQQKVTLARQIIAEVQTANTNLLSILNLAQQYQLGIIMNGVQSASNLLNMSGEAFTANLAQAQYTVTGLDGSGGGMSYQVFPQSQTVALNQMLTTAVTRVRAERANARVLAARQARIVPQRQ